MASSSQPGLRHQCPNNSTAQDSPEFRLYSTVDMDIDTEWRGLPWFLGELLWGSLTAARRHNCTFSHQATINHPGCSPSPVCGPLNPPRHVYTILSTSATLLAPVCPNTLISQLKMASRTPPPHPCMLSCCRVLRPPLLTKDLFPLHITVHYKQW